MSSRSARQYLEDIDASVRYIHEFLGGRGLDALFAERVTMSAVERELLIVAEASTQLSRMQIHLPTQVDWKGFIGMGNIIRHAYHRVDENDLWLAIENDLPVLEQTVQRLLADPEIR